MDNEKALINSLLTDLTIKIEDAGVNPNISLKVAKEIFHRAGIVIPVLPEQMTKAYDLKQIAVMLGVFTKDNKPAIHAVYIIACEAGAVGREFADNIAIEDIDEGLQLYINETGILKIKQYLIDLHYPTEIYSEDDHCYEVVYKAQPSLKALEYFDYFLEEDDGNQN